MDLLKELKELGTQLENKRQNILREVENAAEIRKEKRSYREVCYQSMDRPKNSGIERRACSIQ